MDVDIKLSSNFNPKPVPLGVTWRQLRSKSYSQSNLPMELIYSKYVGKTFNRELRKSLLKDVRKVFKHNFNIYVDFKIKERDIVTTFRDKKTSEIVFKYSYFGTDNSIPIYEDYKKEYLSSEKDGKYSDYCVEVSFEELENLLKES